MAHENARILVVEDEDNLAMLIEYNLNTVSYTHLRAHETS